MFPSRREFMLAFALALVSAIEGKAQISKLAPANRAKMLRDWSLALAAAGAAMTAFANGVASLGKTAEAGWSELSARRTRTRLADISARATQLAIENQSTVFNKIDDYPNKSNPTDADWLAVTQPLSSVISKVKELLDELRDERSDFISEPSYRILCKR